MTNSKVSKAITIDIIVRDQQTGQTLDQKEFWFEQEWQAKVVFKEHVMRLKDELDSSLST